MLEAVNSVLQTAPLVKGNTDQTSTVDAYAANPDRVQRSAPQAPYISPYIYLDVNYDKAVIQLRNGDTGDVEGQFPSEASLELAARQAARQQAAREAEFAAQTQPKQQSSSAKQGAPAPAPQQAAPRAEAPSITPQQQAAFAAAASSGNTNAGNVTLFA